MSLLLICSHRYPPVHTCGFSYLGVIYNNKVYHIMKNEANSTLLGFVCMQMPTEKKQFVRGGNTGGGDEDPPQGGEGGGSADPTPPGPQTEID